MKKLILIIGVLCLTCGAAHAVNYTWQGSTYPTTWDTAANWNPNKSGPGTTGDSYSITTPTSTDNFIDLPDPTGTRYFGDVTMTNGRLRLTGTVADTFRFVAGNDAHSGSFTMKGATATSVQLGRTGYGRGVIWDMDGSFIYDGVMLSSETAGNPWQTSKAVMRGSGTTFTASSSASNYQQMISVTVESGASVDFVEPEFNGYNCGRELIFKGDASGSITTGLNAVGLPANNHMVKVIGTPDLSELKLTIAQANSADNNVYRISGAHYKEVDYVGASWLGHANQPTGRTYTVKVVDDNLRATHVKFGGKKSGGANAMAWFVFDTDNAGVVRNVTADLDMVVGDYFSGVLKANSADIKIGRDLLINNGYGSGWASYITATTGTFKVGRHITVANGADSLTSGWDMGTSKLILNGNDNGTDQTLATKMLPFYDAEVNTTGTVTLADNLLLKGDLTLTAGTFDPAGNYVVLQGGQDTEGTAQEIDAGGADLEKLHVKAGSDTYAKLLSDLTISDNLDIDLNCKLFLNGKTLDLTGSDAADYIVGGPILSGEGTWTVSEGGQIIGDAAEIPEPGTLLLLGTGLLGAFGYLRRRRLS